MSRFKSEIWLSKDGMDVNGKSILGVLMLAAEQGSDLTIRCEGADAHDAVLMCAEAKPAGCGAAEGASGAGSGADGFTPAPGPAASGFESAAAAASGFGTGTGNLIDI